MAAILSRPQCVKHFNTHRWSESVCGKEPILVLYKEEYWRNRSLHELFYKILLHNINGKHGCWLMGYLHVHCPDPWEPKNDRYKTSRGIVVTCTCKWSGKHLISQPTCSEIDAKLNDIVGINCVLFCKVPFKTCTVTHVRYREPGFRWFRYWLVRMFFFIQVSHQDHIDWYLCQVIKHSIHNTFGKVSAILIRPHLCNRQVCKSLK